MLHKKLILILILIFTFSFSVYSAEEPSLSAYSAVLIDAETKEIIYEKNAHTQRSMASTTKIMTAILAVESGRFSQTVTAGEIQTEGSSIGLKKGYKLTLESLAYGMMLESGNDAAEVVAEFLAGSEEEFSVLMNKKADEIGMTNTNFVTASGLDSADHYSTAYDMALLGAYAVENPIFREICSLKSKRIDFIEPDISVTFSNHNKLLSWCDGVFGIKTGFTKKSGRCLVTACERGGRELIAVTLNAGDDWNDHTKLYNYGFDVIENTELFIRLPQSVQVYSGTLSEISVEIKNNPVSLSFAKDEGTVTQKIYLPKFVYAPVKYGDIIGWAELYKNGSFIGRFHITASCNVDAVAPLPEKKSIWSKIADKFKEYKTN